MKANNNSTLRYSAYGDPEAKCEKIHWLYFPTHAEKYITICLENEYKLWDEVFELLLPFLSRNQIGIISIAKGNDLTIKFGQSVSGISLPQASYLIGKSLCHVCAADWSLSLAHHNGIRPVFVKTLSEQVIYNKEYYGDGVDDKEKPELMARAILAKLGLDDEIKIESILSGESYGDQFIEMIPDFNIEDRRVNPAMNIGVRCDLVENWKFVLELIQRGATPTIITKTIPPQSILPFIKNVKKINIWVGDEGVSLEGLRMIEDLGISYSLLSRTNEIPEAKYQLFDFKQIQVIDPPSEIYLDKLKKMNYDTRIKSRRSLVSKDGVFLSVYHWKNKVDTKSPKGSLIMDGAEDQDFINESDLFLYYKLLA